MKRKNKYTIFFLSLIFILVIGLVKKTFQNDTFYTIKIGELIVKNGIDMLDHFSFHTLIYTYPHWLYDVIIYGIYFLGGFNGIYISTIIVGMVLAFVVYKCTQKITNTSAISFAASLVCILVTSGPFITARAQSITYILFVLEILFIEQLIKTKKNKYIIGLLTISLLICNMHVAVWPFYYILFLPYIGESIIGIILSKIKSNSKVVNYLKNKFVVDRNIPLKKILLVMFLSLFTGLLTPIKDTPYTYLIKTMMGNSQKYIIEHQMISFSNSIFMIIILVETILFGFIAKIRLRDLFLILGLSLMTITSTRHLGLLAVIGSICFANTFIYFVEKANVNFEDKMMSFFGKKIVQIICVLIAIGITSVSLYIRSNKSYIDETVIPVKAVNYIKDNIDIPKMRIFNEYTFGSYILFNDIPVFIDSRADLYTKEFSGYDYDIFDDFMNISLDYESKFKFYNISHILIYRRNKLNSLLRDNSNYKLLYEDENYKLYERLNYDGNK